MIDRSNWKEQERQSRFKPYLIERMQEVDLGEVVAIEESSGLNRWGYDAYRRELLKNDNSVMLVARNLTPGPAMVGFFAGWTVEDELHVNNIAAHPQFRRIGIGRSLLTAGIEEGTHRGRRLLCCSKCGRRTRLRSRFTGTWGSRS